MSIIFDIEREQKSWVRDRKPGLSAGGFFGEIDEYNKEINLLFLEAMDMINKSNPRIDACQCPKRLSAEWVTLYRLLANGENPERVTYPDDMIKHSLSLRIGIFLPFDLSARFSELMTKHIKEINGVIKHTDQKVLPFGCVMVKDETVGLPGKEKWKSFIKVPEWTPHDEPNHENADSDNYGAVTKFACYLIKVLGIRV